MSHTAEYLSVRKSILLRPSDQARLETLAREQGLSFGELARRAMFQFSDPDLGVGAEEGNAVNALVGSLSSRLLETRARVTAAVEKVDHLSPDP